MTENKITIESPAKINLYLEVCNKRQDGYHNIKSIMQTVSLYDTVTVEVIKGRGDIILSCNNDAVPCDKRNTAYRAAEYFLDFIGEKSGVKIDIEKNIPTESGLAGGSADAAGVLKALNTIYKDKIALSDLLEIAKKIGADVPFCYLQGCALCRGIGEKITPITSKLDCYYIILRSGEGVSTREAYGVIDSIKEKVSSHVLDANIEAIKEGSVSGLSLYNSFESAVLPNHSTALNLKNQLISLGAAKALMSGSGPSVFGIFETEEEAVRAEDYFKNTDTLCYLCKNV